MSLHTVQKGVSDVSLYIGIGLKYTGAIALCVMAVIGTIAIDLVVITFLAKNRDSGFFTGFLLGSMLSRPDPKYLLIGSPITTIIAIALSFALGVPGVGIALFLGWVVAATLFTVGLVLETLGNEIAPAPINVSRVPAAPVATPRQVVSSGYILTPAIIATPAIVVSSAPSAPALEEQSPYSPRFHQSAAAAAAAPQRVLSTDIIDDDQPGLMDPPPYA